MILQKATGPACPRCGCEDSRQLPEPPQRRKPKAPGWFAQQRITYRANRWACGHCGLLFTAESVDQAEAHHEPKANEPEPAPVIEQTTLPVITCKCGKKMRVASTRKNVRYYKCECGETAKAAGR